MVDIPRTKKFARGAKRSPLGKLLAAPKFHPFGGPPPQAATVPGQLSVWGNDTYGNCVTAEEAFAKACDQPEDFIGDQVVIAWAQAHGYLNGADLVSVLQSMASDGFVVGAQRYNDGMAATVDYSNEAILQAAIAMGPVKIAIDANALPSGAGTQQGWYAFDGGNYGNTDHCVSLCGYGPTSFLFSALGLPVPPGVDPNKPAYLLFTWGTIGLVDHAWLMGTCVEAWIRNPTTVFDPPRPTPPTPPTPPT
ncbi:MAG TPA: hypothetical protein VKT80_11210, partial [Chloroflexota bacterium]|nr:hypothetical protein [Chloroflexota bacterium]